MPKKGSDLKDFLEEGLQKKKYGDALVYVNKTDNTFRVSFQRHSKSKEDLQGTVNLLKDWNFKKNHKGAFNYVKSSQRMKAALRQSFYLKEEKNDQFNFVFKILKKKRSTKKCGPSSGPVQISDPSSEESGYSTSLDFQSQATPPAEEEMEHSAEEFSSNDTLQISNAIESSSHSFDSMVNGRSVSNSSDGTVDDFQPTVTPPSESGMEQSAEEPSSSNTLQISNVVESSSHNFGSVANGRNVSNLSDGSVDDFQLLVTSTSESEMEKSPDELWAEAMEILREEDFDSLSDETVRDTGNSTDVTMEDTDSVDPEVARRYFEEIKTVPEFSFDESLFDESLYNKRMFAWFYASQANENEQPAEELSLSNVLQATESSNDVEDVSNTQKPCYNLNSVPDGTAENNDNSAEDSVNATNFQVVYIEPGEKIYRFKFESSLSEKTLLACELKDSSGEACVKDEMLNIVADKQLFGKIDFYRRIQNRQIKPLSWEDNHLLLMMDPQENTLRVV